MAAAIALLSASIGPAYAQYENSPQETADKQKKAQRDDADKAYQRALKDRGSDAPTKVDPWGNVRASDPNSQSKGSK
jgi:hypothetical protein